MSLFAMPERAVFSACRRYRYALWREWDATLQRCLFVMLNPSTADSEQDDPTIRRCIAFAKRWGFGALDVANMFAWRATDPKALFTTAASGIDIVGTETDEWIVRLAERSSRIVVAWGNGGNTDREDVILDTLLRDREVLCLGITDSGSPVHPLYQRQDSIPVEYWRAVA